MILQTLSVFPEVFGPYMNASIMGRAQKAGLISFEAHDLRDWTHDRHRTVDDAPFGGGQGMLMKPEPIFEALDELKARAAAAGQARPHVVFFSPTGVPFNQRKAEELATHKSLLFFCARYEGVDERAYSLADEVISLGDFVLTGGELAALTVMDATVRLIPGALGDAMSAADESFSADGLLEYEQYTRPASFRGMDVPAVLLSGNHQEIAAWRRHNALERTSARRPDLLDVAPLTAADKRYLAERDAQHLQS